MTEDTVRVGKYTLESLTKKNSFQYIRKSSCIAATLLSPLR